MDNDSTHTIDWPAIRVAYETSDEPLRIFAARYGVSESMVHRRRVKEGWPRRRDTGRVARRLDETPETFQIDWPMVRQEYEWGEFSLQEIARRHGCSVSRIHQQRNLEHWQGRRPGYPRAYGAGGTVTASHRRKSALTKRLGTIAGRLGLAEKIDPGDPLNAMETLAGTIEKLLEARETWGDDGDRLNINDASRNALAERLEALARAWERKRNPGGA